MIFKIQKPITSMDGSTDCLVYNKDRSQHFLVGYEQCGCYFENGELKIYVEGNSEDEHLNIIKKLEQQDW